MLQKQQTWKLDTCDQKKETAYLLLSQCLTINLTVSLVIDCQISQHFVFTLLGLGKPRFQLKKDPKHKTELDA